VKPRSSAPFGLSIWIQEYVVSQLAERTTLEEVHDRQKDHGTQERDVKTGEGIILNTLAA